MAETEPEDGLARHELNRGAALDADIVTEPRTPCPECGAFIEDHAYGCPALARKMAALAAPNALRQALYDVVWAYHHEQDHPATIGTCPEPRCQQGWGALAAAPSPEGVDLHARIDRLRKRLTRHHRDEHVTEWTCSSCKAVRLAARSEAPR